MKKLIALLFVFSLISGCYVPPALMTKQEINPDFVSAQQTILDYFQENNSYVKAIPRNGNDILHEWIEFEGAYENATRHHFERIRNCTDCPRIIVNTTYVPDKNFLWVTFTEFSKVNMSIDGNNLIKDEIKTMKQLLAKKNLSKIKSIKFRKNTVLGSVCRDKSICKALSKQSNTN